MRTALMLAGCLVSFLCSCSDALDDFFGNGGSSSGTTVGSVDEVDCGDEWPEASRVEEQRVFELVNQVRAEGATCGGRAMPPVGPLVLNDLLVCAARLHSQDMALRGFFDHENPDGEDPFDRMRALGYDFRAAAENIARGQPDAEAVMSSWLSSSGHCTNIMGRDFEEFGVGYHPADGPYWTQTFGRQ